MRLPAIPSKQVADMPTVSAGLWQLILHMPARAELRPAPMPRLPRSCGLESMPMKPAGRMAAYDNVL